MAWARFWGPDWPKQAAKGGPHETEFWEFSKVKTKITWKVDENNGVGCLVFMFRSQDMFLKMPKIVNIWHILADSSTGKNRKKCLSPFGGQIFIVIFE